MCIHTETALGFGWCQIFLCDDVPFCTASRPILSTDEHHRNALCGCFVWYLVRFLAIIITPCLHISSMFNHCVGHCLILLHLLHVSVAGDRRPFDQTVVSMIETNCALLDVLGICAEIYHCVLVITHLFGKIK